MVIYFLFLTAVSCSALTNSNELHFFNISMNSPVNGSGNSSHHSVLTISNTVQDNVSKNTTNITVLGVNGNHENKTTELDLPDKSGKRNLQSFNSTHTTIFPDLTAVNKTGMPMTNSSDNSTQSGKSLLYKHSVPIKKRLIPEFPMPERNVVYKLIVEHPSFGGREKRLDSSVPISRQRKDSDETDQVMMKKVFDLLLSGM
ncbi:uncharacterized protein LOC118186861 [Stegodyphus dumicola]|uniref:uncharacterized protein LOC118186861 n=1 Tax=Stegodyphus dumicola TaxID=202533 RepID=UPI0015B2180B|nr:uncharacterized protein LOC118186861 [Stegodyphus dumicola]